MRRHAAESRSIAGAERTHDESGAYAAMFIILLAVLVGATALVVDMGQNWFTRHDLMSTADMAATAGAMGLEPTELGSQQEACESAWDYALTNIPDLPDSIESPCATFPSSGFDCNPAPGSETAVDSDVGGLGLYTIAITTPVADDSPLMQGWLDEQLDGNACFRVGVTIARQNNHLFAGFGGSPRESTVLGQAVALAGTGQSDDVPVALVILEPHECSALESSGQGTVFVDSAVDEDGVEHPGVIAIDSDGWHNGPGSGCPNSRPYVLEPGNTAQGVVEAVGANGQPGLIFQYALMPGSYADGAYRDVNWLIPNPPLPADRVTRERIDHRYNCKAAYPLYMGEIEIGPCPDAGADDAAAHIDELEAELGGSGIPPGFDVYSDEVPLEAGDPCQPGSSFTIDEGDWFIDCPFVNNANPGLAPSSNVTVTFEGGRLIFQGEVRTSNNNAAVVVGDESSNPTTVFVRQRSNGNPNAIRSGSQGRIEFHNTFVYMQNGFIRLTGQPTMAWSPPNDEDHAFHFLSLWSESSESFDLGGGGAIEVSGTFFAPYANPFQFRGQGDLNQPENAQFVVRKLDLAGQGRLAMRPDPDDATQFPMPGIRLIR